MRPKSLLLLVTALGCGLVAALGINQILATPSTDAQTTSIVVARHEIHKGDLLKPDDIRMQEWRVDSLPEGVIQKVEDLAERRVKMTIVTGEAILESKLVAKGGVAGSSEQIPPGMKAIPVKVDAESGGAGLILPGDNVDVMIHVEANPSRGIAATVTKLLLKNIKVHAVDDVLDRPAPGEPSIAAKTVTLIVTPKQAAIVAHSIEIGKIRLVMRSAKDAADDDFAQSISTIDVLGTAPGEGTPSLGDLNLRPLPSPTGPSIGDSVAKSFNSLTDMLESIKNSRDQTTSPEPEAKPWKMIMIEGNESKEVEFSTDADARPVTTETKSEAAPEPTDEAPKASES